MIDFSPQILLVRNSLVLREPGPSLTSLVALIPLDLEEKAWKLKVRYHHPLMEIASKVMKMIL